MIFGRKKEEKIKRDIQEVQEIKLPTLEEIKKEVGEKTGQEVKPLTLPLQLEEKIEKPSLPLPEKKLEPERRVGIEELRKVVPLFVKLEKYEEILNIINDVKNVLDLLKNSFSIFEENEKIRTETVEAIKENIEKVEEKISSLDSILLRPVWHEEKREKEFRTEEVKDTLSMLKSQIDKLKQELQSLK